MLRQATPSDLGYVRSLAQRPENRAFITDEDEIALSEYLVATDCEILIWEPDGRPAGFAIFCEIGHVSGRIELMRLALDTVGAGVGRVFLQALIGRAFLTHGARRIWLDCSGENPRAQRTYVRAGFALEGRLRDHDHVAVHGRNVDRLLYGMQRDEWRGLEPPLAKP